MAENIFMSSHTPAQLGLNINDIIDGIHDEVEFVDNDMSELVGGGTLSEANGSIVSSLYPGNDPDIEQKKKAYVQIIEQPQPKALRFRYICEGRSAGSIPGVRSTAENKTFPTIKIMNYKGPAVVVVSCVTVEQPYHPHPHNLVGKEGCNKGVCTVTIDNESMECMFSNLGIQCVKKKDVEQALKLREEIRVDPFNTGFNHRNQAQSIDLNSVRLCFQVFLGSGEEGRFTFPLKPVVSDPIYDKKATSDLNICKLSHCTSCVLGGKEIILLCDKVTKEDIQVRFFEVKDGHLEWEGFGDFQASDVHKQVAISFKTPKYKDIQVEFPIKVWIQLLRPSDKSTSEPRPFEYLPVDTDLRRKDNKRAKLNEGGESSRTDPIDHILGTWTRAREAGGGVNPLDGGLSMPHRSMKFATRATRVDNVKIEPPDSFPLSPSPEPMGLTVRTVKAPISPQHNGGGFMMQNITPLPNPRPMQNHLQPPLYYPTTSTAGYRPLIDVPLHSPQPQYYSTSPVDPTQSPYSPVDPNQSPYSPENPPGASGYTPNLIGLLPHGAVGEPNIQMLDVPNLANPVAAYQTFNNPKPPVDTSAALPDLGVINSSELTIDSVNNLSATLSSSLNIGDQATMNPLDRKCLDEDKRSINTSCAENFFANIPMASLNDQMKMESTQSTSSSDSVKQLKGQLETLNKLSERS